jgi:hypothetical protein
MCVFHGQPTANAAFFYILDQPLILDPSSASKTLFGWRADSTDDVNAIPFKGSVSQKAASITAAFSRRLRRRRRPFPQRTDTSTDCLH